MKNMMTCVIIGAIFMFIIGCKSDEQKKYCDCPSNTNEEVKWGDAYMMPWNSGSFDSYTEDTKRVFQVQVEVNNVCPDQHIHVFLEGNIKYPIPRDVLIRVKYVYSLYGSTWIPSKYVADTLNHKKFVYDDFDFGIKQGFPEGAGFCYLYYEWVIDDYLDYNVDLDYFKSIFIDAEFSYYYCPYD